MRLLISAVAVVSFISINTSASAFSASFRWCSGSPAFSLQAVPKGTTKLEFAMIDLNAPGYNHGGGTVAYKGRSSVACGAFSSGYNGPSPPPGQVHTYRFDIKAVGADGATLARASAQRKFPER